MKLRLSVFSLAVATVGVPPVIAAQGGPEIMSNADGPAKGPSVSLCDEAQTMRDELIVLRTDLENARNAVLDGFSDDDSREDRAEALNAWSLDHLDEVAAVNALSKQLQDMLHPALITGRVAALITTPAQRLAQAQCFRVTVSLLRSRLAILDALPDEATAEEREQALVVWAADNAAERLQQTDLRDQLSAWRLGTAPTRGARAGLSAQLKNQLGAYAQNVEELRNARSALNRELWLVADDEERQALLQTFRWRFRELMAERRNLKRMERLTGAPASGNRRTGG